MYKVLLNTIFLFLSKGSGFLVFILLTPLLVDKIGLKGLGLVSIIFTIAFFLDSFVEYSFNFTLVKKLLNKSVKESNYIFNLVTTAKLYLFAFGFVVSFLIIAIFTNFLQYWQLILLSYLYVLGRVFNPFWYFIARDKMQFITITTIASKLLYLICVYLLLDVLNKPFIVILTWSFFEFIISIIAFIYILKIENFTFRLINFNRVYNLIHRDFNFANSQILLRVISGLPIFLGGLYFSQNDLGVYSIADKIIFNVNTLIALIYVAVLPNAVKVAKKNPSQLNSYLKKTFSVFFIMIALFLILINVFSTYIIQYFTKIDIAEIQILLLILSGSAVFYFLKMPMFINVVIYRLEKYQSISYIIGIIAFVIIISVLKNPFQLYSISLTVLIVEFLMALILGIILYKKLSQQTKNKII